MNIGSRVPIFPKKAWVDVAFSPIFWAMLVGSCVLVAIFFKNAWVTEDAYINFRSIEQLFSGNGPRWNFNERVQVFTSPFWYWLLALGRVFTKDLYLVAITTSALCVFLLLISAWNVFKKSVSIILFFCFLCSSNGFMDYTTSGLENISSFAAIGWIFYFYSICLKNKDAKKSDFTMLFFLFFLMIFIRHDLLTLVIIPACYIFYVNRNKFSFKEWIVLFSFCSFPIALWTIFSLVYYGFPFPNTAYAKLNTGYSVKDLAPQGINYFLYSAKYDATTILGLVAGVVCSFFALKPGYWPLSLGVLLNVIYVISIGGDFMQGRFVSHSFLVAVFLACLAVERLSFYRAWLFLAACLVFISWQHFTSPIMPVFSNDAIWEKTNVETRFFDDIEIPTIANERVIFFNSTSLRTYFHAKKQGMRFPVHDWTELGYRAAKEDQRILVFSNVGYYGYWLRLDQYVVDNYALVDPLLARLPSDVGWWRPGHFIRTHYPAGYYEHILSPDVKLADPHMEQYVKALEVLTKEVPLFSWKRMKTIVLFNMGRYDHLKEEYLKNPI